MDTFDRLFVSIVSVFIGFLLSQSFDVVRYFRRPRFYVDKNDKGIMSSYTGDPPETPAEIVFGFRLKNIGKNPARNTRIFISEIFCYNKKVKEEVGLDYSELKRIVDIIPPGETVSCYVGKIDTDGFHLKLNFQDDDENDVRWYIEADTRGKAIFDIIFHVVCDDVNSISKFTIHFDPSEDLVGKMIIEDYWVAQEKVTQRGI